jgi:hypothetical protein
VSLSIGWLDPDRILIDLAWHECSFRAVSAVADGDLETTVAVFDAMSDGWGFGSTGAGPSQWMVVDTR